MTLVMQRYIVASFSCHIAEQHRNIVSDYSVRQL